MQSVPRLAPPFMGAAALDSLYTIPQVADALGVCTRTAYSLVEKGKLRSFRIGPGDTLIRVRESDLTAYIEQQLEASEARA